LFVTRTPRALGAICAVLALSVLAAVPAHAANKPVKKSAASPLDKKQNAAIKKTANRVAAVGKRTVVAEDALKKAGATLSQALVDIQANKDGLAGITAAVPTVISSLQQLGDGALALKAGLEQLAAGVTTLAAATTAGFDAVKASLAAQEWGQVMVFADANKDGILTSGEAIPQSILVTGDIPDDTNQAVISGGFDMGVPLLWTAVGPPVNSDQVPLYLMAAVRSAEVDGTGAPDPVAAAGLVSMTVTNSFNATVAGGTGPTTALAIASKPNAGLGGLPLYNIPNKASRAGTQPLEFPLAQAIELSNPTILNDPGAGVNRFNVTNTNGVNPGAVHIEYTVRFSDLTPASPNALQ
jgi:hypothetical protein